MGTVTRMELRKVTDLHPYEHNAKLHPAEQIEKLRRSFREFGMIVPIGIDSQDRVIYGHGRLLAAQAEGWDEVPTVTVEDLTDEQRAAFVHADNLLGETGYDKDMLKAEAKALKMAGFDVTIIGFDAAGIALNGIEADHFWDGEGEDSEEYQEFVDKFKPKLTTDDCYTPVPVYEAVKAWTIKHYDLAGAEIFRPFYPGGDYQAENYPEGCVVIDNPPFSILSDICRWYQERGVRFFLFAPGLTLFSIASGTMNYIPTGVAITYENGASITTSFVTNMGEWKIEICPDLYEAVDNAVETFLAGSKFTPPQYVYPNCLACVQINKLAKHGQALQLKADEVSFTRALDAQRAEGKAIFGGGFLLSHDATERKMDAESAAAARAAENLRRIASLSDEKTISEDGRVIWPLTDRELALIQTLGRGSGHG